MYSGPMCNFCEAAKRLLDRNNLKYEVIDISSGDGIREEMIKKIKECAITTADLKNKIIRAWINIGKNRFGIFTKSIGKYLINSSWSR